MYKLRNQLLTYLYSQLADQLFYQTIWELHQQLNNQLLYNLIVKCNYRGFTDRLSDQLLSSMVNSIEK